MQSPQNTLLCHGCAAAVHCGRGEFYVVRIEAFADPSPPELTEIDTGRNFHEELQRLIDQAAGMSEQEALDQVHRRLTLCLCNACFARWIENPVSGGEA